MFTPKFNGRSQVLQDNLREIDRLRFRIENMLLMPKHEQWLRREAFVRTAFTSTMVENAAIGEDELEASARPSPSATIPKERPDVVNYGKALELVDSLSDEPEAVLDTIEVTLRNMHFLLMSGIEGERVQPGRYRKIDNKVGDQGIPVYSPPPLFDVPDLMRDFVLWLRSDRGIHPVCRAGIAHLHFVAIHPFVDGNGRTARLLAALLLQMSGYGFRKLLSLDAYYQRNRDPYIDALRVSVGPEFGTSYDATPWLEFFTKSIVAQAATLERRLTDWQMTVAAIHGRYKSHGLRDREVDGLIYAVRLGQLTRGDYCEIAGVGQVTATRDLRHLAALGLLEAVGTTRARRYLPAVELKEVPRGGDSR
jgi:Fic family protein